MARRTLPHIGGPGLRVLFVGINPSLTSAATGHHFARPGNRFWAALHGAGFTPRLLRPAEDGLLPTWGLGITNLVDRATRTAAELAPPEYAVGARRLERLVRRWEPGAVAIVGLDAWRRTFGDRRSTVGPQSATVGGRPAWVVPNPSGLNAHYQLPALIDLFAALRSFTTEL